MSLFTLSRTTLEAAIDASIYDCGTACITPTVLNAVLKDVTENVVMAEDLHASGADPIDTIALSAAGSTADADGMYHVYEVLTNTSAGVSLVVGMTQTPTGLLPCLASFLNYQGGVGGGGQSATFTCLAGGVYCQDSNDGTIQGLLAFVDPFGTYTHVIAGGTVGSGPNFATNGPALCLMSNGGDFWFSDIGGSAGGKIFAGNLNLNNLPTSSAGLSSGDVWRSGSDLKIV
jgi:hypothetical protein